MEGPASRVVREDLPRFTEDVIPGDGLARVVDALVDERDLDGLDGEVLEALAYFAGGGKGPDAEDGIVVDKGGAGRHGSWLGGGGGGEGWGYFGGGGRGPEAEDGIVVDKGGAGRHGWGLGGGRGEGGGAHLH